jgi:hypothetical protein
VATTGDATSPRPVAPSARPAPPTPEELDQVVRDYCTRCHSARRLRGNLSLEEFEVASAAEEADVAERMIVKLRTGMMPPADADRPGGDTLVMLARTLESTVDAAAGARPNPGSRVFQRLNRAEYARSVEELFGLTVDAAKYLPPDTRSANFDNIADVQMMSPTLMGAFLNAASEMARLALGDPHAVEAEHTYAIPRLRSQWERVDGAPYGSRGGTSVVHTFPADGTYNFRMSFHHSPEGYLYGRNEPGEAVEVSIDGERVALLPLDRFLAESDPGNQGLTIETGLIPVRAGPHRISAVFIPKERGPVDDLFSPHGNSIADTQIGIGYGLRMLPHMRDLVIRGPKTVTGVSETPSRSRIFTCRPTARDEERPCARTILSRLATEAYRRPATDEDLDGLLGFYDRGAAEEGFEAGIRLALEALLASPHFVFRFEEMPDDVDGGETYALDGAALASRLSFFLWGGPPDATLVETAREGKLDDPDELREQAVRMLADPRAEALGTRFAGQWLRLQDLEKLHPDVVLYPDYDLRLADAMRRETELFFNHLVQEDRPVTELLTADYTFVNERLAEHYDLDGVVGDEFRRVVHAGAERRGVLGQGSFLAQTSLANRTSPVNRGKWVAEVLLGSPPPPPPPNVPSLDESAGEAEGSRLLSTRERLEMHRQNPTCNACHRLIDPIGIALEPFDVTGKWRLRDNGVVVDAREELYDGTPLDGPASLTEALLRYETAFLRNFASNLMAYALGRRVEYYDMPEIRALVDRAREQDLRTSAFILGVVESDAFRMKVAGDPATDMTSEQSSH